ncbi:MAG: hypothetical protein GX903_05840 [Spirochaetales bacterium]|nr:hypothetical protein [Spirochaetales bacterium]
MKKLRLLMVDFVSALLIMIFLVGCNLEVAGKKRVSEAELTSKMITMVDRELETVLPYVTEDLPGAKGIESYNGRSVIENTMSEEQGRKYLEFCYEIENASTPEAVVAAAEGLISKEDMEELKLKVEETKEIARSLAIEGARSMTNPQKRAFFKDLRSLVIKSTVLLAAGIVYACIPTMVFWGKITAACAVAVAAGVVASGVLSVVEYYQFEDSTINESFEGWVESITKEPYTSWAIAASVIATGKTMGRSPVLTGVILAIFAIYNVIDQVKPMLKKYNFNI